MENIDNDALASLRVLVTGADGVAKAITEAFVSAGASVFVCDLREEAINNARSTWPRIGAIAADVSKAGDVERIYAAAVTHMGGVDALVNVVGVSGPTKLTENVTTEEWHSTMSANLYGMFYTARAVIPDMKARRRGVIINFSTASTRTLLPQRTPYIVSKFAVEGLTRNLARELGPHNIRVNAILPGGVKSDRLRSIISRLASENGVSPEEFEEEALRYVSMRTFIEPQELAEMTVFLCSARAGHITGQLIGVDGNMEWEQ